ESLGGLMIWVEVVLAGGDKSKLQAEGRPGLAGLTGAWSLVQKFGAIFCRRAVVDRAMGMDRIVFVAETASDALGLKDTAKQFPIEGLVTEAAIEAFIDTVLPRAAGFDESDLDAGLHQPFLKIMGNELRSVVATQVQRLSMDFDQGPERGDHVDRAEAVTGDDVQAVVTELVDDGQKLHGRPVRGHVEDDVDAPYVIDADRLDLRIRPQRHFRPPRRTGNPQAFQAANALYRPAGTGEAFASKQGVDPAIAIAGMPPR